MTRAVRLQTVRYGGSEPGLLRMMGSLVAGVRCLRERAPDVTATVAIGDCGGPGNAEAVIDPAVLGDIAVLLSDAGIELDYVVFATNTGHGHGQNLLARRAFDDGAPPRLDDIVVFVNPDTYLSPGCIAGLVGVLGDDSVGIAEGRQLPLEHPKPFDLVTGDTPWASGCLMAVGATAFDDLGGFEPAFFLHGDDVDLSWRMRLRGLRVCHVPAAAVFHDKRPAASGFPAPAAEEEYQAMLARFLLAHRAERRDVVDWWLDWAKVHASARQLEAAAEFEHRRDKDILPATYREALGVSKEAVAEVACFVGGEYAEHRF
ncbi:MAG: glycosyltransferase family protein [Acidimicrobiales bacterium]